MAAKRPRAIISLDTFVEPSNILIYGDSGVGKTVLAASAPNNLILATEAGTVSAKRMGRTSDVWPCPTWDEFVKAYRWLYDNPDHGYTWVTVDNAGDMQQIMGASVLEQSVKVSKGQRDEDIMAIQDYQKWYNMFKRYVKAMNALPVNVLWVAHSMRKVDDEGEDVIMPAIQGQDYAIAQWFCGQMQSVGYMQAVARGKGDDRTVVRRILWEKMPPYFAKDRYDALGRWYVVAEGKEQKGNWVDVDERIKAALASTPTRASRSRAAINQARRVEIAAGRDRVGSPRAPKRRAQSA